jgi:pyruvate/2-oxoglutarate dehydrogenase complex dihydrolipoamide dehydrogenase (E3) component
VQETAPFDWTTFKKKRDAYVARLNGIYERNLGNDKVEYVHGWARLLSRNEVEVTLDDGSKTVVRANKILIAVGGYPTPPPSIPGAEFGTNSDGSSTSTPSPAALLSLARATSPSSLPACSTLSASRPTSSSATTPFCATSTP